MPELPEVETLARDLRATVLGRTITEAWVSPDAPRLVQEMPVDLFCAALRGQRIEQVSRRGKYLLVGLDPSTGSGQASGLRHLCAHLFRDPGTYIELQSRRAGT